MSLNFTQICESVLEELQILEEGYVNPQLEQWSKKALKMYNNLQNSSTQEEVNNHVRELFKLRERFIEEYSQPTLNFPAKTKERVEELMNKMAENETSEHPRVHGTHFLTLKYLKKYERLAHL